MNGAESYAEARAELRAELLRIPDYIRSELKYIDEKLAAGFDFIVNDGGGTLIVHEVKCPAIARQFDRELAWRSLREEIEAELSKPNFVPHSLNSQRAKMPSFFTREEVEQLEAYKACGTCQPLLSQREKKAPRKVPTTKLRSLGERHLGREFVAADGAVLGRLKAVRLVAEFESGTITSDDVETVSMVPLDSSIEFVRVLIREHR